MSHADKLERRFEEAVTGCPHSASSGHARFDKDDKRDHRLIVALAPTTPTDLQSMWAPDGNTDGLYRPNFCPTKSMKLLSFGDILRSSR